MSEQFNPGGNQTECDPLFEVDDCTLSEAILAPPEAIASPFRDDSLLKTPRNNGAILVANGPFAFRLPAHRMGYVMSDGRGKHAVFTDPKFPFPELVNYISLNGRIVCQDGEPLRDWPEGIEYLVAELCDGRKRRFRGKDGETAFITWDGVAGEFKFQEILDFDLSTQNPIDPEATGKLLILAESVDPSEEDTEKRAEYFLPADAGLAFIDQFGNITTRTICQMFLPDECPVADPKVVDFLLSCDNELESQFCGVAGRNSIVYWDGANFTVFQFPEVAPAQRQILVVNTDGDLDLQEDDYPVLKEDGFSSGPSAQLQIDVPWPATIMVQAGLSWDPATENAAVYRADILLNGIVQTGPGNGEMRGSYMQAGATGAVNLETGMGNHTISIGNHGFTGLSEPNSAGSWIKAVAIRRNDT